MIKKDEKTGKWLVDIQPGGRGHKRIRKTFDTKIAAKRYEVVIQSRMAIDPGYTVPKKDVRKLSEFVSPGINQQGNSLIPARIPISE